MNRLVVKDRYNAFVELGVIIGDIALEKNIEKHKNKYGHVFSKLVDLSLNSNTYNTWFTEESIKYSFKSISLMLNHEKVEKWIKGYSITESKLKVIAVIMAGNIPIVGFHDFLSVLISGNKFYGKLSAKDDKLLPAIAELLVCIEPLFSDLISFTNEKMTNFNAVIATGGNSSSVYFDYYFSKYPNIIRKNRNSIAVLSGNETRNELSLLANDIFKYFGLGCRNVSKLYVPIGYSFEDFYQSMNDYEYLKNHFSYNNNYDHNKAIYLINSMPHLDNGFLLLKEEEELYSPLSVIHYEYYEDVENVYQKIHSMQEQLQCIVSGDFYSEPHTNYGETQSPELWDYSDGVDVMKFLTEL